MCGVCESPGIVLLLSCTPLSSGFILLDVPDCPGRRATQRGQDLTYPIGSATMTQWQMPQFNSSSSGDEF